VMRTHRRDVQQIRHRLLSTLARLSLHKIQKSRRHLSEKHSQQVHASYDSSTIP